MEAKMQNFQIWINLTEPAEVLNICRDILIKSGFNVLQYIEHYFKPHGYTALFLLSESHLAVHTFPEKGRTYIELTSCVTPPFKAFVTKFLASKFVTD